MWRGTTAPERTTVQTLTVDATGGTFVLHFLRPNSDGVLQDVVTAPIAGMPTSSDVLVPIACLTGQDACELSILSAALNPNNDEGFRPHTDNIRVTKHGNTFHFYFQGEDRFRTIAGSTTTDEARCSAPSSSPPASTGSTTTASRR